MQDTFFITRYTSPFGRYIVLSSRRGLACVAPEDKATAYLARWQRRGIEIQNDSAYNHEVTSQLDAYFAGKLRHFSLPLDLKGTEFECQVWKHLCSIPYGETRSYGQIASSVGRPTACRAVGRAIGKNPVSIVVPCHRVIGSTGELTGYADGLDRKQALLDLEAAVSHRISPSFHPS